ncbi:MAG: hypothetical protein ABIP74_03690 [Candidatus Saccharimonas sp.]
MNHLNDEQLSTRIDAFLARKQQQYPELTLRQEEKYVDSIGDLAVDKFRALMASSHIAKLVR